MRTLLLTIGIACLISCSTRGGRAAAPPQLPVKWEVAEGLTAPESAYLDVAGGLLFVSNVGAGGAVSKDGDGYISKLTPEGKMLQARWVTGLNAPKGLRSHGGTLWVADIDRLVAIDIAQGAVRETVEIDGAKFLNDVACDPQGAVYVSDMLGNRIYRHHDRQTTMLAEGDELEHPNGLLVQGDRLVVAGWGLEVQDDFSTATLGRLFSLNLSGGSKRPITREPLGNLDGVEAVGREGYLVSDWLAGKVFLVRPDGATQLLLQLPPGAADLGYLPEQRLLIVPQMLENKLTAFELPPATP